MTKVTHLSLSEEGGGLSRRRIHLREICGDADSPLETVGQDLREARLRRGDDLATVSKVLKIRKDHIEALEEDRLDALPGRTYAIGFVRTYAEYLGLDARQCVERYKAEIAGRDGGDPSEVNTIDEDEQRRLPSVWKIVAGVVVVLILYGAYYLATSFGSSGSQPVAPVPASLTPESGSSMNASPQIQFAETQGAQTPADAADAQEVAASSPAPTSQPTPVPADPVVKLPQGRVYGLRNHGARVVLKAYEPTRVLVQGTDGTIFMNQIMQAGDSYQVPNLVGVHLTTANAGALQVDLDGLPMGRAGKDQQMVDDLSLDPQAIVDRFNRAQAG